MRLNFLDVFLIKKRFFNSCVKEYSVNRETEKKEYLYIFVLSDIFPFVKFKW